MAVTNYSTQYAGDVPKYIAKKALPLARRQLVAYRFAAKATLPKNSGTQYTATRFNRLNLPQAPLSEGIRPNGQTQTISQVTGIAQQWGDLVTVTDVAQMTIAHDVFQNAIKTLGYQIKEYQERNSYLTLNGATQVNYVNQRGSRAALVAGDVLDTHTLNRTVASLMTVGAPRFMGDEQTDVELDAGADNERASTKPRMHEHYVGLIHPLQTGDLRENNTVILAWSYSDINRLYNFAIGEWGGIVFCESNMIPYWTGVAAVAGAAGATTTGGTLSPSTTYYTQVTGSGGNGQYETLIYQIDGGTGTGSGGNNSLTLTLPSTAGYTYSVYIGTSSTALTNIATTNSTQGAQQGPYVGQAVGLPPGATVTLLGLGIAQVPPAAPATGLTVFPTYIIGRDYYTMIELDDVKIRYLTEPDKSDPLNQLRIVGWTQYWGMLISNQLFGARIEATSNFTPAFG